MGELHPGQQRTWKEEGGRSHEMSLPSQSTWGSEFATGRNQPMLLFLGQCRNGANACVCWETLPPSHPPPPPPPPQGASAATGGILDVWELPGHSSQLFPSLCKVEAPEDIPLHTPLHIPPTQAAPCHCSRGSAAQQSQRAAYPTPTFFFGRKELPWMPLRVVQRQQGGVCTGAVVAQTGAGKGPG